ncbi:PD-(D/E)XK nuclease family protein [Paraburkholderia unamae]|uniref:PD-(D/E)XK nuclease family protein n=1 Tax=Paraburkholderia unamae TaxID=219649 RepID=A0ACC6RHS9_9BURK
MPDMQPWTYSHLDGFETCPRQFHAKYVLKKFPWTPTAATKWGDEVHKAFESRIRDGVELPASMQQWSKLVDQFANLPGTKLIEKKLAVDKNFQSCDYWESWSRGNVDLSVICKSHGVLVDWKTGKYKPSEQLMLYAGYAFANWPQLETVQTGFVWLKDKKIDKRTYTRDDVPVIWQEFVPRVRRLELAYEGDKWPARPSGLCKGWCPVRDCEHWKEKP